jgi:hypothetical protein
MRGLALLCALLALGGITTAVATTTAGAAPSGTAPATAALGEQIVRYQRLTWRWQREIGAPRTESSFRAERSPDPAYRRWVLQRWKRLAQRAQVRASRWLAVRLEAYRGSVEHWERVMGVPRGPLRQTAGVVSSLAERHVLMTRWRARARRVQQAAANPPYASAWRCIHRYEGAWTDGGGPYYGGLQMDIGFQRRYGAYLLSTKGTADHWTPEEQMWVAVRALRSGRGFGPWPHTARACGLL